MNDSIAEQARLVHSLSIKSILGKVSARIWPDGLGGTHALTFESGAVAKGGIQQLTDCVDQSIQGKSESLEALCIKAGLMN
jgi:hypothetical protein